MVAAEAVGAECPQYPSSGVLMGYRELQVMESQRRIGISGAPALGTQWETGRGDGELWRVFKEGRLQHLSTGCIMARSRYWGAVEAGRGRVCSEQKQWTCPVRM